MRVPERALRPGWMEVPVVPVLVEPSGSPPTWVLPVEPVRVRPPAPEAELVLPVARAERERPVIGLPH